MAFGGPKKSAPRSYCLRCYSRLVKRHPGECPERQRGRTVNPLAYAFVGSSPTSPTILLRTTCFAGFAQRLIAKQDALRSLGGGGRLHYVLRRICSTINCEAGCPPKPWRRRAAPMRYVYLLQSDASAGQRYVGITSDLKQRLTEHNA